MILRKGVRMQLKRVESKPEVEAYISKLKYALQNGAKITFQIDRQVDVNRDIKYTNKYTVASLFPNESPEIALKKELLSLSVEEYQCTVKDERFPKRSEMRVFGRTYNCSKDVYIKIRVELMDPTNYGNNTAFVMSFHFAEIPFNASDFPYRT